MAEIELATREQLDTKIDVSKGSFTAPADIDLLRNDSHVGTYAVREANLINGPAVGGSGDPLWFLTVARNGTNSVMQVATSTAGMFYRLASSASAWAGWKKVIQDTDLDTLMAVIDTKTDKSGGSIAEPVDANTYRGVEHVGTYGARARNIGNGPPIDGDTPTVLQVIRGNSNGVVQRVSTVSETWERVSSSSSAFGPWRMLGGGGSGLWIILGLGDSMTTDYGSLGKSTIAYIGEQVGVQVVNSGRSGNTPTEIAWRLGALRWGLTVVGNVLPTSGQVEAFISPDDGFYNSYQWDGVVYDRTGKEVPVRLRCSSVSMGGVPTWTAEQLNGSGPVIIAPGSRVRWAGTADISGMPAIVWMGRNDSRIESGVDRIERALSAVMQQHRDPAGRMLVLPVFNRATEPSGTAEYVLVEQINERIAEVAGSNFFDARRAMIDNGLMVANITPNADDLTAISEDRIPGRFLMDITHLNELGREVLAVLVGNEIKARNWR